MLRLKQGSPLDCEDLGKLGGRQEVTHSVSLRTALNLDPFMIPETFLYLTETAFGNHPCRVVSITYCEAVPFHGGNTGSNPVGGRICFRDRFSRLLANPGPSSASKDGQN
jgi:hypothetical protein